MLYPDLIFGTIDYIHSRVRPRVDFSFVVNTNGTLFSPEILDRLEQEQVKIFLSLDGGTESQDKNRQRHDGRGSFSLIEPYLERLVKMGASIEKVIAVNTFHDLIPSIEFLFKTGFREIISIPDFNGDWTPDLLEELETIYLDLAVRYLEWKKQSPDFTYSLFDDKITLYSQGGAYRDASCGLGTKHFVIATDGSIYPCTRFAIDRPDNAYRIGHYQSGFDTSRQKQLQKFSRKDKASCQSCEIKNLCLGNQCSCIAYSLSGRIDYVSPLVCEHERMIYGVIMDSFFE